MPSRLARWARPRTASARRPRPAGDRRHSCAQGADEGTPAVPGWQGAPARRSPAGLAVRGHGMALVDHQAMDPFIFSATLWRLDGTGPAVASPAAAGTLIHSVGMTERP